MAGSTVRADSGDGRRFAFTGPASEALRPGDIVVLHDGSVRLLGQVTHAQHARTDGRGQVLGVVTDDHLDRRPPPPFASAALTTAERSELRLLQTSSGADLPVGTWISGQTGEDARLRAQGAQAAVLRLDPLRDRGEYNLFIRRAEGSATTGLDAVVAELSRGTEDVRALAQRIENLGLLGWEVWAYGQASVAEAVGSGGSMTVLDLNGFRDPHESTAVCLDLVEQLWARRADRTPTLLVLDEAHNLCPKDPSGTIQAALVDRLVQIAAEGRKYGIWLLLSTQRPSKIHPQVLSQCDNLVLMRMNSHADLAELATVFGSLPPDLIDASPAFTQGEALIAGPVAPVAMLLKVGDRITVEGGSDVRVPDRS